MPGPKRNSRSIRVCTFVFANSDGQEGACEGNLGEWRERNRKRHSVRLTTCTTNLSLKVLIDHNTTSGYEYIAEARNQLLKLGRKELVAGKLSKEHRKVRETAHARYD